MTFNDNRGTTMNIDDLIKLPASEAAETYRELLGSGEAQQASRFHQAYYEAHRVRLSDDGQVKDTMLPPPRSPIGRQPHHQGERSTVRRVGMILSTTTTALAGFMALAGVGGPGVAVVAAFASTGLALWLVGVLEDRLIEIRVSLER
jgi:hypothetical protein